jgi:hypothetical protein
VITLSKEAERLFQAYQNALFIFLAGIWVLIGGPCLWVLRVEVRRLLEYFTWVGLKYMLFIEPRLPSLGILFCIVMTLYVLISQSRYELVGLMKSEQQLLERTVHMIRQLPRRHPLHRWLFGTTPQLPSGTSSQ